MDKFKRFERMNGFNRYSRFNLQMFADDGADGAGGAEDHSDNGSNGADGAGKEKPAAKYTDEDLDRIIGQKFAAWQKAQEKKLSEAERLGKMSAEEKAAEHLKDLEKRIAAYEKADAQSKMTAQARAILQGEGLNISDNLIANLIADDADSTKAAVDSFVKLFRAEVEKAMKEKYKGETPRKGSSGAATLTKEQILAMPNRVERQKAMEENRHLF